MSSRRTTGAGRVSARNGARAVTRAPRRGGADSYASLSTKPLHVLAFLAPLVVAYEIGSVLYLTDPSGGAIDTIRAHRLMGDAFHAFGVGGLFLPGVLLAVVLLVWHLLTRDGWRLNLRIIPGMLGESVAWTLPLLVLWQIVARASARVGELAAAASASADPFAGMSLGARLTVSVGAGLYEELLFRMLGIALLHFLFADLLRMRHTVAAALAVTASAALFAVYHVTPGEAIDWTRMVFYTLAGMYFGAIYAWRGFGIVVAVHALYDVVVLVLA